MSVEDQLKWDRRFRDRGLNVGTPEPFLVEHFRCLQRPTVLDVAGGNGRNALFLAQQGFQVTVVDVSPIGLRICRKILSQKQLDVRTELVDLERGNNLINCGIGPFDSIIVNRYKPDSSLWNPIVHLLLPGGTLMVASLNVEHCYGKDFAHRYLLEPQELVRIHPDLELLYYRAGADFSESLDGYIFRKSG